MHIRRFESPVKAGKERGVGGWIADGQRRIVGTRIIIIITTDTSYYWDNDEERGRIARVRPGGQGADCV
jgi:hypothetical protein